MFLLDVAQLFVRAKIDDKMYMNLSDGCGDMSLKIFASPGHCMI